MGKNDSEKFKFLFFFLIKRFKVFCFLVGLWFLLLEFDVVILCLLFLFFIYVRELRNRLRGSIDFMFYFWTGIVINIEFF